MRGLVQGTIEDVFITGYSAATDGIKGSFLSFVEKVFTNMNHSVVFVEALHQNFERWSSSYAFIKSLIYFLEKKFKVRHSCCR